MTEHITDGKLRNPPNLLEGLRVLDLTRNLPGPFATHMLAQWGASVCKIEPPNGVESPLLPSLFAKGGSAETSQVLNLKEPADCQRLTAMVEKCDVLVESFRPGVLSRLGLSHDKLKAIQPRLVMCSITGYGQTGPWSHRAGHDMNFMAMSGALDQGRTEQGDAALSNVQWGDIAGGGLMAVGAILAGVFEAHRSGHGRHLDVSMTHGLWAHMCIPRATQSVWPSLNGRPPGPGEDLLNGVLPSYRLYRTQDNRYLAVGALEHKFWRQACEVFARPDWAEQHWQRGLVPHSAAAQALREEVATLVASQPLAYWSSRFEDIDACVTPVLTLQEAQAHPLFAGVSPPVADTRV